MFKKAIELQNSEKQYYLFKILYQFSYTIVVKMANITQNAYLVLFVKST